MFGIDEYLVWLGINITVNYFCLTVCFKCEKIYWYNIKVTFVYNVYYY